MENSIVTNTKDKLFEVLFKRQNGNCYYCGKPMDEIRYLSPIHRLNEGGEYSEENCVIVHIQCHMSIHGNLPNSKYPDLYTAYKIYKRWQDEANRMNNVIKAYTGKLVSKRVTASPYFDEYILH